MPRFDIPFERQQRVRANRLCGAAALAMVLRSLGVACSQEEVWEEIARPDRSGTRAARTYLLAASALRRGLQAGVIQTQQPWRTLQEAARQEIPVILNHRLRRESALGHYTVLLSAEDDRAVIHDPHFGPRRSVARDELLELWGPVRAGSEVTGHVLVAITRPGRPPAACRTCGAAIPAEASCPKCKQSVPLQPASLLGCLDANCPGRAWGRLFCPTCDYSLASPRELR